MDYNQIKNKMKGEALDEQEAKFYEMTSKGKLAGTGKDAPGSPFGMVSSAPSQTTTGAAQGESFEGSGGYKYGMLPDGAFVILKSGRGAAAGTVVKPGMRGFNAIKSEFEAVKAGKSVSSTPSRGVKVTDLGLVQDFTPSRGVKVTDLGLVQDEAPDTKLLRRGAMRRQGGRDQLTRDLMWRGMPLEEAREFAKRLLRPGGNDSGEPEVADTRMARK
jgi:hypothetical protein